MVETNLWLSCYKPNPKAKLRLFCFPFAGGGSSIYRTWGADLPDWIEVCPVQFPGRENRILEKPFTNLSLLATTTITALMPYFTELPFAFFGHSMGAWVCYEMACNLRSNHNLTPKHLFVSAHFAPHIPDNDGFHLLPDKDFRERLRIYNGTPQAVLENEEIMQLVIPLLRADFSVCETYNYTPRLPLECPLTIFTGKDDSRVNEVGVSGWQQHTSSRFRIEVFEGDHFFLRPAQKGLTKSIVSDLQQDEK